MMSGVTPEMLERKEHELYGMRQRRIEELERTMASMKVDAEEGRGREAELRAQADARAAEDARERAELHAKIVAAEAAWQASGGAVMGLEDEQNKAKPWYRRGRG